MGGRAMVQTHDWKYAHYGNGDAELFDLNSDPQECINLAGESKYQAEEHHLRGLLLEHHFQQQRFQGKPFTRPSSPYLRAAIDDFEKERAK
jgi:arylsulfatase A-like enzyme